MRTRLTPLFLSLLTAGCVASAEANENPDLVPVTFQDAPIPACGNMFGATQVYAFYTQGEAPVAFRLEVSNNNQQPVEVELRAASGESIASEVFETGEHDLSLPVSVPGLYFVEIRTNGTIWRITLPEGAQAVLCLDPDRPLVHHGALLQRYFYVPKGIREVRFTTKASHPKYVLNILNPGNEIAQTFTEQDEIAPILIPEGMDGAVWSFQATKFAPRELFFENIPNYLAGSPNALLLPKPLVEKDEL